MKLTALRLHNVRRFAGQGVAIENIGAGVNVLTAANEVGKSTCFDALHALFFLAHGSASEAVRALRPYSGGNPLVEAEIETSAGAFRLSKQFLGSRRASVVDLRSNRLIAQADEAEAFIGNLVRGGTTGPAGLLWVRQGVTGLETRAKTEEQTEKRARETVLTSVQGELEQLTGGRRMAQVLAQCEAELALLVTASGKPKANGPYAAAVETYEKLSAQEAALKAEVEALRIALEMRRDARAKLNALEAPDAVSARQQAVVDAEQQFNAAKAQGEALKAAEARTALAANQRQAAEQRLAGFLEQKMRHSLALQEQAARSTVNATAQEQLEQAKGADHAAQTRVDTCEGEERAARKALSQLEVAIRADEAREKLAGLKTQAKAAEQGRIEKETLEGQIKAQGLSEAQIAPLEAVETEVFRLGLALNARLPSLSMQYRPEVTTRLEIEGEPLNEGDIRPVSRNSRLVLPGLGTLTIALPASGLEREALSSAQAKHRALLAELGVESLAQAKARVAQTRSWHEQLTFATKSLALLVPQGLGALRTEIARLEAQSGEPAPDDEASAALSDLKADPQALRLEVDAAETAVSTARLAQKEAKARLGAAQIAAMNADRALSGINASLAQLEEGLGPLAQRAEREAALQREAKDALDALEGATSRQNALKGQSADLATAQARLERVRSVQEAAKREINHLNVTIAGLNGQIETRAEDAIEERWRECADKVQLAQRRLTRFRREVEVLTRLKAALAASRDEAREHYFMPLMQELKPLLSVLFEQASVTFDESTLLPGTVMREGLEERVEGLSGGMREQLAILTRLAFARLLARDGQITPVILDDALVYSDDDRIERMFDALHRQGNMQQILVFSCRQRAFARLGGTVLHMTPWQPAPSA